MANWVPVTTKLYDEDGTTFDGSLLVRLMARLVMPDGEVIGPGSWTFPVEAGVAKKTAGGDTMELPITEDANPEGVTLGLAKLTTNGLKSRVGSVSIDRPAGEAPYTAIDLDDILPVGEEE